MASLISSVVALSASAATAATSSLTSSSTSSSSSSSSSSSTTSTYDHEEETTGIYAWGGEWMSPSLSGLINLACRKVKLIACSSHCMVVTKEAGGQEYLWTWGANESGQCGLGEAAFCERGGRRQPIPEIKQPRLVMRGGAIQSIAASVSASAVVRASGDLLMCGGLPGEPRPLFSFTPVPQSYGSIQSVAMGDLHTMLLVSDFSGTTQLVAWGTNSHGQLGLNPSVAPLGATVRYPTRVDFNFPAAISHLACGTRHTVVMLHNHAIYAWGKNVHVTMTDSEAAVKPRILGVDSPLDCVPTPMKVSGSLGRINHRSSIRLAASDSGTFLLADKKVWSWGECCYGSLGQGAVVNIAHPTQCSNYPPVVEVACGTRHTLLLDHSGNVYAMGYSRNGATGIGTPRPDLSCPTALYAPNREPYRAHMIAAGCISSLAVMELQPIAPLIDMFNSHPTTGHNTIERYGAKAADGSWQLPPIIEQTLDYLEALPTRFAWEGIWRVEGRMLDKRLFEKLWQTGEPLTSFPEAKCEVPTLTFAVKSFLFACDPLFTYGLFDAFFEAALATNPADRISRLGNLLRSLPQANWLTIRRLYQHGMLIIANEPRNRMGLDATSRMWGNMSLRCADQSPSGLLKQSEVEKVARPVLQYGHILFNDFLWTLFSNLYLQDGALALEICDLIANEPFRNPEEERLWIAALDSKTPAVLPNESALRDTLFSFHHQFDQLTEQAASSPPEPHIRACLALIAQLAEVRFRQYTHPVPYVLQLVLRCQKKNIWQDPVKRSREQARPAAVVPHAISSLNLNFMGEHEASRCVRQLQELALQETTLAQEIAQAERRLEDLWQQIEPVLDSFRDLSHQRHARLEELLYTEIWPRYAVPPAVTRFLDEITTLGSDVLRHATATLNVLSSAEEASDSQQSFAALATEIELATSVLRCDKISSLLREIEVPRHSSIWRPPPSPPSLPPLPVSPSILGPAPSLPSRPPPVRPPPLPPPLPPRT